MSFRGRNAEIPSTWAHDATREGLLQSSEPVHIRRKFRVWFL